MMKRSKELFERAKKVMPGGVNSPVRAYNAVGGSPQFIKSAKGSKIYDEDGKEYIDYIGSWGPMILGHANPKILKSISQALENGISFGAATALEVDMAELMIKLVPSLGMVRMVNSGTEAVMSALRTARGYTGREKIMKFSGCYHGHSDSMLVKAGSGLLSGSTPNSGGVTVGATQDTLIAVYNHMDTVEKLFEENKNQIAAVIVEPVAANMGVVLPKDDFLKKLRKICTENGTVLIFDEVITGFRLALGGAQEFFGIEADMATYGKIIGGGMPVGAYGGKREIMECVAPLGDVYQAGTLSGNPLAMASGIAMLKELEANPMIYEHINNMSKKLAEGVSGFSEFTVNSVGSLTSTFMTKQPVDDYDSAMTSDTKLYAKLFNNLSNRGVYVAPAQFEAMFMSSAHSEDDVNKTLNAIEDSLKFAKI